MAVDEQRLAELVDRLEQTVAEIRQLVGSDRAKTPPVAEERSIRAFADEALRARDA